MRVLFLVRRNLREHPGGDTTQILQTAEALRACGIQVDLSADPRPDLRGYDLAHLFHLDRVWENVPLCRRLRKEGRPAVLSTIYWPPDEFDRGGRAGLQGRLARAVGSRAYENLRLAQRWLLRAVQEPSWSAWRGPIWRFAAAVRYVLETVAVLLPNSRAELEQIQRRFGVQRPAVVVPNAVEAEFFRPPTEPVKRRGVLCVGRIEPRKNQHRLIAALKKTDIPVTIVGSAGRFSAAYRQRCLRELGPHMELVDAQPPDVLRRLYQSAQVHACVSWYETPGLASLEAAACGCALVVTPGGCTREYFGELAHYGAPDDPDSIRAAVQAALEAGPPPALAERVRERYTWQAAARQTLAAYEQALANA